jgi:hypothetical protein
MRMIESSLLAGSWLSVSVTAILLLVGSGCASQEARDDARALAAYTNKVKLLGEQFAHSRDELDRARQRNTDILEGSTVRTEQEIAQYVRVWKIAGLKDRDDLFAGLLAASQEAAAKHDELLKLRQEQEQRLAAIKSGVKIRSDKLAQSAKATAQLAETPDLQSQTAFYVQFFKSVNETIKADEEAAKKAAEDAKKSTEKKSDANASPK